MTRRRKIRSSISIPITLGAITVLLSLALLVGWSFLLGQKIARSADIAGDVWLLVLGALSFVLIIVVLVLFVIALARGIIEVRKQDTFIDSVTHELKSPLASLQLCLETLGRAGLEDDAREKLRRMMFEDVDRLRAFIDDVLEANRLSYARPGMLNLSDVSLSQLAEHSAEAVRVRHKLERDEVFIDVDPELVVTTDRAALEIVVNNLIDNAAKYSERPARIEVVARRESDKKVRFEVRDKGIGIDRKNLKRVFHRFYRVEDQEVRQRRGTGLGLFVVWALVKQLGGDVQAFSEGRGQGTTMRVALPVAPVENTS
ncbi:MAG: HAMP domain-containing histidine kinase [Deltaproteobacteria bacterium]|nr:HAMP domain-containing histidine kinase [Deltaproteobacteria bacterium]